MEQSLGLKMLNFFMRAENKTFNICSRKKLLLVFIPNKTIEDDMYENLYSKDVEKKDITTVLNFLLWFSVLFF